MLSQRITSKLEFPRMYSQPLTIHDSKNIFPRFEQTDEIPSQKKILPMEDRL